MPHPILYSLQNCPYAIRARMGLLLANQIVTLRAVVLKDKPDEMLAASPKGSVPVLVLDMSKVIDESIDIMLWALRHNDPHNLLFNDSPALFSEMADLIKHNDDEFQEILEKYKLSKRHHEVSEIHYRQQCEIFITQLEQRLNSHDYFMGDKPSLADYAILPFIRQFSRVDKKWFRQAPYPKLRIWLSSQLQSQLFSKTMIKYPLWLESHEEFLLGDNAKK